MTKEYKNNIEIKIYVEQNKNLILVRRVVNNLANIHSQSVVVPEVLVSMNVVVLGGCGLVVRSSVVDG